MKTSLAVLSLIAASALPAQGVPEGYRSTTVPLLMGATSTHMMRDRSVIYFTGTELVRDSGSQKKTLLRFSSPVFGSFTRPMGDALLFGESSNGDLYLVDPEGTNPARKLATLPFNYDAAFHRAGFAVVSAKVGGFSSPDNDFYHVDLRSGVTDLLVRLPGASGPVAALAEDGTLLCATASPIFPAPRRSSDLLAFSEAQVLSAVGATHLTRREARLVHGGLDSASAIAVDDDRDVFVADLTNKQVHEVDDLGAAVRVFADLASSGLTPTSLQFARELVRQAPVFEPFQPQFNWLVIGESDFSTKDQLRSVIAARPTVKSSAQNPIPRGPFAVDLQGGPAGGHAVFFIGTPPRGGGFPVDAYLPVPGFEFPFFWALDFVRPWISFPVTLDASGAGRLALVNPGTIERVDLQAFLLNARGLSAGSSDWLVLGLAAR
jgi:hypothetical protein